MDQISMASLARPDPRILSESAVKPTDSPQKIKDAAQQFEGLLLSQVLETAHQDGGWLGTGDSSSGAAMSFGEQQLAATIAQKGGLGLAGMIAAGLEQRSAAAPANPPVPNAAPPSPR
jgi:Rod binding domain-containing protein